MMKKFKQFIAFVLALCIENTAQTITEWNENAVRQIVERVTVLSADEVLVRIKGGAEIKQRME